MSFFSFFPIVVVVSLCYNPQSGVSKNTNDGVPIIFAFGDSNTDTGNYAAANGVVFGYPTGRFFPHQPSDRAGDGKLIIDYLCENVTANYLHAHLNALEPKFRNGVNFAFSSAAATSKDNTLSNQLKQFTRFQNRSVELLSKGSKQELVREDDFKRALYLIDIGQNDMGLASYWTTTPYDHMVQSIPNVTLAIKNAMKDLYYRGGRKFWVHNTGPLGCLPGIPSNVKYNNATDLDEYGCIKFLNEGAQLFNKNLSTLCEELQREMNDATIVYVDIYTIKYDLIANASSYGFEDPLTPCVQDNTTCEGTKTISWEGWHYTHAANAFVASRILSTNYSTPSLPFNFFMKDSIRNA